MADVYVITIKCSVVGGLNPYTFATTPNVIVGGSGSFIPWTALQCRNGSDAAVVPTSTVDTHIDSSPDLVQSDIALLVSGVLLVWAIAWVFRQVIAQISNRR